jgi:hypothetical protein
MDIRGHFVLEKSPTRPSLDRAAEHPLHPGRLPSYRALSRLLICCGKDNQTLSFGPLLSTRCLDACRPGPGPAQEYGEGVFEGRGAGKANLAEQCCYSGYSTPLPRGVVVLYKLHLARSHILFPSFLHSLEHLAFLGCCL